MNPFISKHAHAVIGTLSGFDRLVFRGTLRFLSHTAGMKCYLWTMKVLLKDFATHAQELTQRLRAASEALVRHTGRPVRYLASSSTNKEEIARAIAEADGIKEGLICILTAVEQCQSFEIVRDRAAKELRIEPRHRGCLFLYHYQIQCAFRWREPRSADLSVAARMRNLSWTLKRRRLGRWDNSGGVWSVGMVVFLPRLRV